MVDHVLRHVRARGLAVLTFAVCAVLALVNVANSPDIISDEATYALVGRYVANLNSLTFGSAPIVVHPPLYFLTSGGWLTITGHAHSTLVSVISSLRLMNGLFTLGVSLTTGLLARAWLSHDVRVKPLYVTPLAMIVAGSDGFLLRFGRTALLEPMAIFFAVIALLVSWRLRNARLHVYLAGTGIAIGVALLVKQPALFIVASPVIGAILRFKWRGIVRQLGALLVGLFIWASFPFWAWQTGNGHSLYQTQTLNIRRLLGLVQVTGLNRKSSKAGGGAASSVRDTFTQFAGAYVIFLVGAVALVALAWRLVRQRGRGRLSDGAVELLALGLLSYAFLAYSVLFGQSNQQLTMYTVPAAAVLATWVVLRRNPTGRVPRFGKVNTYVSVALAGVGLIASLIAAFVFYPARNDNATARVEAYISQSIPPCTPVNSTGNSIHWAFTLRTNPISGYSTGPQALANGTHLFLVSPRDAKYGYGNSSPQLNKWVETHGHRLFSSPTLVYGNVSLWQVGKLTRSAQTNPAKCVPSYHPPIARAPAPGLRYLGFLGIAVGIVLVIASAFGLLGRRRRSHISRHSIDTVTPSGTRIPSGAQDPEFRPSPGPRPDPGSTPDSE